jgi:hypothetical protein
MKKRVVKLDENAIERLVKKVLIAEEEEGGNEKPKSTLTRHPAYPVIDDLGNNLEDLKRKFKNGIANAVSGSDGYHSDIDKFSSEFTNFIGKVEKLKQKINDYQTEDNDRHRNEQKKRKMQEKQMHNQRKDQAKDGGRNYSY